MSTYIYIRKTHIIRNKSKAKCSQHLNELVS